VRPPHEIPKQIGPYSVTAQIGEGGMACVYLATRDDGAGGRKGPFALKVIREEFAENSDFARMFADESKLSTGMRHPNVVRVEESGAVDGRLFLAMEVLSGQSLWQTWQACRERGVRLRYDLAAWICARAADGLHHAHELRGEDGSLLDLVHRDVNQSNLFITYEGDVKVIDFGLAKAANRVSQTAAGVVKGKLSYLAPEQVSGSKLDRRADIFALGVLLWEVTVDRRLFKGRDDIDTLLRVNECHVPDATTLVDGYPPRLWQIVSKCLQKDREGRYATAQTLATDLDLFVREQAQGVGRDSVAEIMNLLFSEERRRAEEWFATSARTEVPVAPLRTETTALLMHNMPSLPPPPKVDLWLGAAPSVFTGRAQPASERSGSDMPDIGQEPNAPSPDLRLYGPPPGQNEHSNGSTTGARALAPPDSHGSATVAASGAFTIHRVIALITAIIVLLVATFFVVRLLHSR
jgi:serine/threonine protein kinase